MKIGFAFGEHIKTEKLKKRRYSEGGRNLRTRSFLLPVLLFIAGSLLLTKLFYLQIVKGSTYVALSDSNRIRTLVIHAPRGVILDREGEPIVQNMPGFRQIEKCHDKKCTVILTQDQALPLIAKGDKNIEVDSLRSYPFKDQMSHILGYTGQVSKEELDSVEFKDYPGTDWVGKSGIEREYEHILRGNDGKELVEVDASGKKIRSLGITDPIPGQDLALTIDSSLQKAAFDATNEMKRGAVIVGKPDGEILALVSRPSYDPNLFTLDKNYKVASESAYQKVSDVLIGENQPLLNRVIGGTYPPGSTFKIVTAASGLQTNIIDENYKIVDTGIINIGEFSFANWYYTEFGRKEQGELNVVRALARSNDIFFYKLAEKVSVDRLSAIAVKMGLGAKTGIDLGGEQAGLVPTKKWKADTLKENWYLGDTYHYGIGQGYLLTTPLQVNEWTSIIASGGDLNEPHLLKSKEQTAKSKEILSKKTINLIRQGMIESCSTGGVAWPLFDFKVNNPKLKIDGKNIMEVKEASSSAKAQDLRKVAVACKTGTAQHGGEETKPHAWITLFAPAYNPEIVVTVLKEESGEGSNEAAPIAKKILEKYFSR
mgnify:CR=1 FL=1